MYKHYLPAKEEATEAATASEYWTPIWQNRDVITNTRSLRSTPEWRAIKNYVPAGAKILDAGCGLGRWSVFLKQMGYRPVGMDISSLTISRLKEALPGYEWHQGDVRRLPFADGEFDALISWGLIEHFADGPAAVLAEFRRVLKPGGKLVVTVPYLCWRRRWQLRGRRDNKVDYGSMPHVFYQHILSERELAQWLVQSNFNVRCITPASIREGASRFLAIDGQRRPNILQRILIRVAALLVPSRAVALMELAVAEK